MQVELTEFELRYASLRITDRPRAQRLVASMCEQGQQTPVTVIRGEAQPFVLIDGYARVQALRTLAKDLVEATVLDLPEVEALVMGTDWASSSAPCCTPAVGMLGTTRMSFLARLRPLSTARRGERT